MMAFVSGAALFAALSLAPGPRLAGLCHDNQRLAEAAALAADGVLWGAGAVVAWLAMVWIAPDVGRGLGAASAGFLLIFLTVTLSRRFDVPERPARSRPFFDPLVRPDLWFDALIVFPAFALATVDAPAALLALVAGALAAAAAAYGLAARPALSRDARFWWRMRWAMTFAGLGAVAILVARLLTSPSS